MAFEKFTVFFTDDSKIEHCTNIPSAPSFMTEYEKFILFRTEDGKNMIVNADFVDTILDENNE